MSQAATSDPSAAHWLPHGELQRLVDALRARGWAVRGPVVRDGVFGWDAIDSVAELPVGWRDAQAPGSHRLEPTGANHYFGVVHGAESVKRHVFAPREPLLQVEIEGARPGGSFRAEALLPDAEPLALLGVRACDLAALAVQDRIFLHDRVPDAHYAARRARLFLVAVGCTRSVSTCFCASMDTGPAPRGGYDLALAELAGAAEPGFVVRAGSDAGRAVLADLALGDARAGALAQERDGYAACAAAMQRGLPQRDLRELLYANLGHPRWDDVAARCLSCANCTLVCPTCFCHGIHDEPSLDATGSVRVREWSSCFDPAHAQVHGTNFRPHVRDRYRQWLVHKLASWIDQFDTSGCVGCGRCISWCPVGIDLTEEVAAIAAAPGAAS
jgi:ferredoxin